MNENYNPGEEIGYIKPQDIEHEMQSSYLDYAMSVIVARALPDVRDGLKPVHRRILYAMGEMGLYHNHKHTKCAKIVGEVLGKYHPHGDLAVYDTMVRMAQNFAMRYTLVDGQGNFGSMDGDSAAAMRYTEARMAAISQEMLGDINKDTVDFVDNYDGTIQEPSVLPTKIPQLLLNGSVGIAVGMATNIPTHNLSEVADAIIHYIDNPKASNDDLMAYIKGPDFPTGGSIHGLEGIKAAYTTGRGKIVVRGEASIEEGKKGGFRIIISELPYQVNKSELILKMADLVKTKKIEGISDLRDESDRKKAVRIIIDLKTSAHPKKILNQLFEMTSLQTAFHVNFLALVNGLEPRVLTIDQVLKEFIKHRQVVVRRRTQFLLTRAEERVHILEGLKIALDHIDEVIGIIKKSPTKEAAQKSLREKFELSEAQAAAILDLRLSALAALERQKIDDELAGKQQLVAELKAILADEKKILTIIKEETFDIKERFGDKRRTRIISQELGSFTTEDLIPNETVLVTLTKSNYIKRVPVDTYKNQGRGGKGIVGMATKEEDTVEHLLIASTHDDIMFFTDRGRVFTTKVYNLPATSRQSKGQAIVNVLQISPEEKVTAIITLNKKSRKINKYLFMATEKGIVKKTKIDAYLNIRKTGIIAMGLKNEDKLRWVKMTGGHDKIMLVSHHGQGILFEESQARPMGRSASGVRGMKLRINDALIAMDVIRDETSDLLTVLENGFGKRTRIKDHFKAQNRGGIGVRASKVSTKTGNVVGAMIISGDDGDLVMVSQEGQMIRIKLKSAKRLGRDTQGVTLMRLKMKLKKSDKVASVTLVRESVEDAIPQLPVGIPIAVAPVTLPVTSDK
jgi:DNA gyrase subunit A